MRLLVLVLSLLFMSVAVANEGAKESEAEAGVKYIEMTPKFTVNLAEPKKFLLINVQLLIDGASTIAAVKKHMPALRHELIMLYSGRSSEGLQTMEQREALRQETTNVIRKTLAKMIESESHSGGGEEHSKEAKPADDRDFKEAYFTEFLVD
ncbi:flagellar basal body-associated FliL family protein [Candidatus Methylobacter oryzae]|uniref:Flagellar protein FliL n=1 Tax=Candidatus Methylobacter oryzae TaxID=2497749 RepID=A0ABY3CAX3_9GAMM|nr:flagellar basal body-associated FliL family protein [Candidatus Methylobacter oryzae]TRW95839.1 flagellar basal body-associated FliL family protein [Candidatus Methylobacter oryzae]